MYFDLNYDNNGFTGSTIRPDDFENPDLLHNYALCLKVKNPAIRFSETTKAGKLNSLSDYDFEVALKRIKTVSGFFNDKEEANVFHVLAEAVNYILKTEEPLNHGFSDDDREGE